jgi:hypothetical protein
MWRFQYFKFHFHFHHSLRRCVISRVPRSYSPKRGKNSQNRGKMGQFGAKNGTLKNTEKLQFFFCHIKEKF